MREEEKESVSGILIGYGSSRKRRFVWEKITLILIVLRYKRLDVIGVSILNENVCDS